MAAEDGKAKHLVVFIHGLWGSAGDFANFVAHLAGQPDAEEFVLLPISKNASTMDGVRRGAERALDEVRDTLANCEHKVDRISLVGHSLGGIYARYLAYLLEHEGMLEDMEPLVFATFATPHLGVRKPPGGPISAIWNTVVLRLFQTTRELGLLDGSFKDADAGAEGPILHAMGSREDFLRPLRRFRRRVLYSNIKWDFQVPYPTTAIRHRNPYKSMPKRHRNKSSATESDADGDAFDGPSNDAEDGAESDAKDSLGGSKDSVGEADATAGRRKRKRAREPAVGGDGAASATDGALLSRVSPPTASATLSKDVANFTAWSLQHVDKRRFWHSARSLEHGVIDAASSEKEGGNGDQGASSESALSIPHPASSAGAFARDSKRELLREMLFGLDVGVGGWERYDVSFLGVLAHEQIINKRKSLPGRSVVQHFYKHVLHPTHQHKADPDAASYAEATTSIARI